METANYTCVETVEQAIECIGWYRCRWLIEELFRVLKRKGFMIEDAQLETVSALQKLILISLQAALQVMVLKLSFDKEDEKLSSEIYFTSKEIALLHIVGKKSEGKYKNTSKIQYKKESNGMGSMDYCKVRSMECIQEPVHSRIYYL